MQYTLNIGCNVNEILAFSPAFALSKVTTLFKVVDSASFTARYPAEIDGIKKEVEERTLVVTVENLDDPYIAVCDAVFCVASILDQKAIAFAPESDLSLGALEGPAKTTWCGGKFIAEYFVGLAEAKRREALEKAQLEANKKLLEELGFL